MKRFLYPLGAALLLGACAPAWAQTYYEQTFRPARPVHWHVQLGYSPTAGPTSQYFDGGFTFGGGLTWRPPGQPLGLRADLEYSRFDATRNLIAINERAGQMQIDSGYGEAVGLSVDGEYRKPLAHRISGFALAGVGVDYFRVALTQTFAFGSYFCNPWFGFCSFGLVPGQLVVASGSTTRLSWNAGLGLDFRLRNGETFFVEARYQRIETRQPTEFVPLTVGLRF